MKFKINITILLFSLTFFVKAQFVPVGTVWHFEIRQTNPPFKVSYYTNTALQDTVIENDTFTLISPNYLLKQEGSTIYYYVKGRKLILFDTGANIGDTLTIDAYYPTFNNGDTVVSTRVVIDTIYKINGNQLDLNDITRIFLIRPLPPYLFYSTGFFTEKILSTHSELTSIFEMASTMDFITTLRCFNSSTYSFKADFLGSNPCDFVGLSENDIDEKVKIYPIPSQKYFIVQITDKQVKSYSLYDSKGSMIEHIAINHNVNTFEINTSHLPKGNCYIILELQSGERVVKKISIQQ